MIYAGHDSMVCDSCGVTIPFAILHGSKRFCEDCYIKMRPPTLVLVKHWTNNCLFDPKQRTYINKDIDFFNGCGFRLFNRRIFRNQSASPVFKEYITLRYYGNLSCLMMPEFKWPKSRQYCRNFNCCRAGRFN